MLDQAAQKLTDYEGRVTLRQVIGFPLPFPDNSFDMVACMEALEVMPEMDTPLRELFRVLRPGGFFWLSGICRDSVHGFHGLHGISRKTPKKSVLFPCPSV